MTAKTEGKKEESHPETQDVEGTQGELGAVSIQRHHTEYSLGTCFLAMGKTAEIIYQVNSDLQSSHGTLATVSHKATVNQGFLFFLLCPP